MDMIYEHKYWDGYVQMEQQIKPTAEDKAISHEKWQVAGVPLSRSSAGIGS